MLRAESLLSLAEGDRDTAVSKATEALAVERDQGWPNPIGAQVVWIADLLGPEDLPPGEQSPSEAREALRRNHWISALEEPRQLADAVR